ncbi:MAG: polymer-forming cytoskeletal protein [Chloroflexota bacterium]|nr:polymer-forming cytoskeletal protein [Chloroflexota bacterium]
MKKLKTTIFIFVMIALLLPATVHAKDMLDDKIVFGGTYTLNEDETLNGNLVVIGGVVMLETGSTVNGDVVLMGGTIDSQGTINGNLIGMGGAVALGQETVVNGDLVTIGATINREEGAQINGQVIQNISFPFNFTPPSEMQFDRKSHHDFNFHPLLDAVWFFFRIFIWAALAILLIIFFAPQADRVARAALNQTPITFGVGLITAILTPLAFIALLVTILLIPVAIILPLVLGIAWILGWISLGLEVGRRIAKILNQKWAPAIAAGIGTMILYFTLAGFDQLVPCVGWLPRTLVGLWGLGAVMMTYFGTRDYPETGGIINPPLKTTVPDAGESDPLEVDSVDEA